MINIPSSESRQWKQANNSDLYGNIHITKNINFDEEGYLKLSNSCRSIMNTSIDADFDNPAVILYNEDYDFFVGTWDKAFSLGEKILTAYPTEIDPGSGVPATDIQTDAILLNGQMPVSQDTDLDYYDLTANTWTDTNISLTNKGQHPLENFLSYPALAVANVNTVGLYTTPLTAAPTLITTLTLPSEFEITSMRYHNQYLYIGTRHKYGGHAYMYVWNGQGSAAQQHYEVDSNIIFSLCVHQGTIWALSGQGELLRFNGGGFERKDALPIFYTNKALTDYSNVGIYKNIMKSNGDVLYIMITNGENSTEQMLNQPDGIWCYDEKVGLYHRYSLSSALVNIDTINTSDVNITTNEITVSTAPVTGTEVYYVDSGGTAIAGLADNTKYFTIKVNATTVKLATTKVNALAGTAIDLTGTGNNSQKLIFFPNADYGQFFNYRTMSLCTIDRATNTPQYGTDLIWGAEVYQRQLTGDDATLGTTTGFVEARGYFITPKIFSTQVTDLTGLFTLKWSKMKSELDKIIVKYRTEDDRLDTIDMSSTAYWRGTWTSTTTFTTTQTDWANAVVGNEIEILTGAGGGLLAHITEITSNSGTYTVTIDETFDNYITGDICTVVFRNWTKFTTIDNINTLGYLSENINMNGKFIKFKVELRGLGTRIEEMKLDNKYLLPAER